VLRFQGIITMSRPTSSRPASTNAAGQASAARQPNATVSAALTADPATDGSSHIIAYMPYTRIRASPWNKPPSAESVSPASMPDATPRMTVPITMNTMAVAPTHNPAPTRYSTVAVARSAGGLSLRQGAGPMARTRVGVKEPAARVSPYKSAPWSWFAATGRTEE
jgi:hypothetical protein